MQKSGNPHNSFESHDNKTSSTVWEDNFRAGEQLSEIVRTTLGPKGLDKLLVTRDGKLIVTNDGSSILDRLDIQHPSAKLVAEVAQQQKVNAGDGTTSSVLLAGSLLKRARLLREQGIHPTKIVRGYEIAATHLTDTLSELTVSVDIDDDNILREIARTVVTGKWDRSGTDFLAERAVEAVRAIEGKNRVGFEKITRKIIPGKSFYDSEVIDGLVIDMGESSTTVVSPDGQVPNSFTEVSVALIDEELSINKPTGMGAVSPDSHEAMEKFRGYEDEIYHQYVKAITDTGADVVFCQQSIDDPVRHRLADHGVLAVERTRRDELNKLARATGGEPVTIEHLNSATVGYADTVERRRVGPTEITVVSGFDEFDQVSILFRGGTKRVAEETKRKLDDCFYVLKLAIEDEALLPGGGASEMALARELRSMAPTAQGREQLAIEAVADAIEIIPRTLAENAGMDPIDTLVNLRKNHSDGSTTTGVNLQQLTVDDMEAQGVLEPLHIKRAAIASAIEAANLIIRIDDSVSVSGNNQNDDHEDHSHGPGDLVHSTDGYPWAVGHSMGHD